MEFHFKLSFEHKHVYIEKSVLNLELSTWMDKYPTILILVQVKSTGCLLNRSSHLVTSHAPPRWSTWAQPNAQLEPKQLDSLNLQGTEDYGNGKRTFKQKFKWCKSVISPAFSEWVFLPRDKKTTVHHLYVYKILYTVYMRGCSQVLLCRNSTCRIHGQATGATPRPARGPVVAATWASTSCWRRTWCRWRTAAPWTACKTLASLRVGSSATMMQSIGRMGTKISRINDLGRVCWPTWTGWRCGMKTNPISICLYGHVILNHPIDLKEVCLDILSIEVRNGFSCLGQKKTKAWGLHMVCKGCGFFSSAASVQW